MRRTFHPATVGLHLKNFTYTSDQLNLPDAEALCLAEKMAKHALRMKTRHVQCKCASG